MKVVSFIVLTGSLILGCAQSQDTKFNKTEEQLPEGTETDPTSGESKAEVLEQTETKTVAKIDPDATSTLSITASETGSLAGTTASFAPGSLSIATNVTVQEGDSLYSSSILTELDLPSDSNVESGSKPVNILPSVEQDPVNPFTLAIDVVSATSLATEKKLVIFFNIIKYSENQTYSGIIPNSVLDTSNPGKVKFDAAFFGTYQAMWIDQEITERVEKTSEKKPEAKTESTSSNNAPPSETLASLQGTWSTSCVLPEAETTISGDLEDKEFEFNSEGIEMNEVGTYTIGQGGFDRLDFENDWITDDSGKGLNIKAEEGTVVITSISPKYEGTYTLSKFRDGDTVFTGSISGSFSIDVAANGGTFVAVGSGDLAAVTFNENDAYIDEEEPSRYIWTFENSKLEVAHEAYNDTNCDQLSYVRFFTYEALDTGVKKASRYNGVSAPSEIEATGLELKVTGVAVNNMTDEWAQKYHSGCGTEGTQSNKRYDVTPGECGFPKIGDKFFNIIFQGSDTLEFGYKHAFPESMGYPTYIDSRSPMTKKQ